MYIIQNFRSVHLMVFEILGFKLKNENEKEDLDLLPYRL